MLTIVNGEKGRTRVRLSCRVVTLPGCGIKGRRSWYGREDVELSRGRVDEWSKLRCGR
jgi:hypothetical protein